MFVLLFLTPVFEKLPYNTMAAIIIVGVAGLVEFEEAIYLFKVKGGVGGRGGEGGWRGGGGGLQQGEVMLYQRPPCRGLLRAPFASRRPPTEVQLAATLSKVHRWWC
jgi:hypothetical protein